MEKKKNNVKKLKWLLPVLLLLVLAGGVVWYWADAVAHSSEVVDSAGRLPVLGGDVQDGVFTKGMTAEEIEAAMQAIADKSNFTLQLSTEMVFRSGKDRGQIEIVNPKSNAYPISVDITLASGELVYQSGLILPDQYIAQGQLLQNLPKGDYSGLATVTIYNEDQQTVEGVTTADMKIIVNN